MTFGLLVRLDADLWSVQQESRLAARCARTALLALLALAFATSSCATTFEEARVARPAASSAPGSTKATRETRCYRLADSEALWSSLGASSTLVAGASGVASLPVEDRYRPWTIGTSIVASALATFSQLYGRKLAETWARECSAHVSLDLPEDDGELATGLDACARAAKRLDALHCPEARPDFAAFCRHEVEHGVPICPTRLARIKTCAEVATVCR